MELGGFDGELHRRSFNMPGRKISPVDDDSYRNLGRAVGKDVEVGSADEEVGSEETSRSSWRGCFGCCEPLVPSLLLALGLGSSSGLGNHPLARCRLHTDWTMGRGTAVVLPYWAYHQPPEAFEPYSTTGKRENLTFRGGG